MNPKAERVRKLLQEIIADVGFDTSESGTEAFLVELDKAVVVTKNKVQRSHAEGLCYDCATALAYELVGKKGKKK